MSPFQRLADKTRAIRGECISAFARNRIAVALPGRPQMAPWPRRSEPHRLDDQADPALQSIMTRAAEHIDRTHPGLGSLCLRLAAELIAIEACASPGCGDERMAAIDALLAADGLDADREAMIEAQLFFLFGLILKSLAALELTRGARAGITLVADRLPARRRSPDRRRPYASRRQGA
jgi:hypothetical protein